MSLLYPIKDAPNWSDRLVVDICPEIKWLRMPLPMSLNHINCYLIKDGEGWCIIDTGMKNDVDFGGAKKEEDKPEGKSEGNPEQDKPEPVEAEAHWKNIIDTQIDGAPITRLIVTHQHPDHIGLAGWLCREYKIALWTSQTEYLFAKSFSLGWEKPGGEPHWHTREYFIRAGIDPQVLEMMKMMRDKRDADNEAKEDPFPFPTSYTRIREGHDLKIGEHTWQVIATAGHAAEHISLFCEALDVYVSGDQVLPIITSNVSVMPTEPEANPLEDWIYGLKRIKTLLPDTPLVLPSHQLPFKGLHERLDELVAHHDERMGILIDACKETSKSAFELTSILFDRELDGMQQFIATGECIAHLHCLFERGEIKRETVEGKYLYTSA